MGGGGMSSRQKGYMYLQMKQIAEAEKRAKEALADEEERKARGLARRARGRRASILTGGMGVLEEPPLRYHTLLGE